MVPLFVLLFLSGNAGYLLACSNVERHELPNWVTSNPDCDSDDHFIEDEDREEVASSAGVVEDEVLVDCEKYSVLDSRPSCSVTWSRIIVMSY